MIAEGEVDINEVGNGGNTPLHDAAANGHYKVVKMLICAGARVDIKNDNSETPLHQAIECGTEEAVEALIDGKCILDHPNAAGKRPIHIAAERNNMSIIEMLVNCHAKIDGQDKQQETVLMYACRKNW